MAVMPLSVCCARYGIEAGGGWLSFLQVQALIIAVALIAYGIYRHRKDRRADR